MIREKFEKLVEENFDVDINNLNFNENISENDEIDSIDLLDFVMTIEDEFEIEFSDDELDNIKTLNDMIEILEKKVEDDQ
ncbi:MAG: phosphopantetheine-binding protein [Peptoniphilaceae bacterium]|nr:phosphopantetheine-binding protein [Peptoniphilaceae bacterium]MDD7382839.1 phosphopantetheine-binding protein [Peptoniphilaceae bacterium]MDY3738202.1 phosphopantetheine-binding protein [Peptoniphilaceae bacterium]